MKDDHERNLWCKCRDCRVFTRGYKSGNRDAMSLMKDKAKLYE